MKQRESREGSWMEDRCGGVGGYCTRRWLGHAAGITALVDFWGVTFKVYLLWRAGDGVLHLGVVL